MLYKKDGKYKLTLSHRFDFEVGNITKVILNGLYKMGHERSEIGEIYWHERMGAVDYLMNHTIFSKYLRTQRVSSYKIIKYEKDAQIYMTKLGYTENNQIKITDTGEIVVKGELISGIFTTQERRLLSEMLTKSNVIFTYDEVADILWKDKADEKFSLYAIAKVIENIRTKLRAQGLRSDTIRTIRGCGYYLQF